MATQTGSLDLRGVKQSYEGVSVGGRNLYAFKDVEFPFVVNGVTWTLESNGWIRGTGTVNTNNAALFNFWGNLPATTFPAGDYTLTVENDGLFETNKLSCQLYYYDTVESTGGHPLYVINGIKTVSVPGFVVRVCPFVSSGNNGLVVDGRFRFKFEKGTKSTEWTPAPEDVEADINAAQTTADTAQTTADNVQNAVDSAVADIAAVANSVSVVEENVNTVQASVDEAKNDISDIERIVGASSWVTGHGVYNKSSDTTVNTTKDYYTVSATAVSDPTGSPHKGLYYELSNGVYILTPDDIVVSGKTYYVLTATLVENPSGNPSTNGYYEQSLNESIEDYLSAHIHMDSDGLFVSDGSESKVQINSTGVSIWNGDEQIASYGSVAQIGSLGTFHILIGGEDNEIGFYLGDNKMAYLNGDELYVQNSLSFGNAPFATFTFYQRPNGHFTLKLVD